MLICIDLFTVVIAFRLTHAVSPARTLPRPWFDCFRSVTIRQGFNVLLPLCGQLLHASSRFYKVLSSNGINDGLGGVGQLGLGGFRIQLVYFDGLELLGTSVVGKIVCKARNTFDVGVRPFLEKEFLGRRFLRTGELWLSRNIWGSSTVCIPVDLGVRIFKAKESPYGPIHPQPAGRGEGKEDLDYLVKDLVDALVAGLILLCHGPYLRAAGVLEHNWGSYASWSCLSFELRLR